MKVAILNLVLHSLVLCSNTAELVQIFHVSWGRSAWTTAKVTLFNIAFTDLLVGVNGIVVDVLTALADSPTELLIDAAEIIFDFCIMSSVQCSTLLALERYWAVFYPHIYMHWSKKRLFRIFVGLSWIFACISTAIVHGIEYALGPRLCKIVILVEVYGAAVVMFMAYFTVWNKRKSGFKAHFRRQRVKTEHSSSKEGTTMDETMTERSGEPGEVSCCVIVQAKDPSTPEPNQNKVANKTESSASQHIEGEESTGRASRQSDRATSAGTSKETSNGSKKHGGNVKKLFRRGDIRLFIYGASVTIGFVVCFVPSTTFYVLDDENDSLREGAGPAYYFAVSNSLLNPCLYAASLLLFR